MFPDKKKLWLRDHSPCRKTPLDIIKNNLYLKKKNATNINWCSKLKLFQPSSATSTVTPVDRDCGQLDPGMRYTGTPFIVKLSNHTVPLRMVQWFNIQCPLFLQMILLILMVTVEPIYFKNFGIMCGLTNWISVVYWFVKKYAENLNQKLDITPESDQKHLPEIFFSLF